MNRGASVDSAPEFGEAAAQDLLSALDFSNACIRRMDGIISHWCAGNLDLYGWTQDEAVGRNIHGLLLTGFPAPLEQIESELLREGSWRGELMRRTKQGVAVQVGSHWVLRRSCEGSPRSVIEIDTDITERRRAEQSAQYLTSLIESSEDAIISKSLNGLVTSWNFGAERLFGYTEAEMVGNTTLRLFPPDLLSQELEILSRIGRGERIQHYETVRLSKTGRRIPVSLTVSPILHDGKVIGASKIVRDISDRRALESLVRASEERQRLAVEAGHIGLWSYETETREFHGSDRCKLVFRLPPGEPAPTYEGLLGRIHSDDASNVDRAFQATLAQGAPFDMDFRLIDRQGAEHWLHVKGSPHFSPAGKIIQVHGSMIDFTARMRVERDLKRTNSQLRQFAHAAAHDLQEPMRNIALSIELAMSRSGNQLDPQASSLLACAVDNAHRMEAMIRDLLAYSKVLHELHECKDDFADASETLNLACRNLAVGITGAGARVTCDHLPSVKIAKIHLLQLFQNLIDNALKHRGSESPRIHVGASTTQGCCKFSVSDNGLGIEPEFQRRVFDVFKRLRKRETPGTGMGLALCKRIVERYGGRIWIGSDGKSGTTVFFTLTAIEVN